jgi:hypothetical protein
LAPLIAIALALCSASPLPPPAAHTSTRSPASLLCSSERLAYPAFIPAGFHLHSRAPSARSHVRHATQSRSKAVLPARPSLRQASMAEGGGGGGSAPGEPALGALMRLKGRSRMSNGRGWGSRLAVESTGENGGAIGGSTLLASSSGKSGTCRNLQTNALLHPVLQT